MSISRAALFVAALIWAASACGQAPRLLLDAPLERQVFQRQGFVPAFAHDHAPGGRALGFADVAIRGHVTDGELPALEFRVAPVAGDAATPWKPLDVRVSPERRFEASIRVDAGGWHRLEIRTRGDENAPPLGVVEPFGVGEVFLIAGQSYATNANDERLTIADPQHRVAAYDSVNNLWRPADDPQPTPDGSDGGSIWPPFADALVPLARVPIGLVNVAVGGTSSTQWLPEGELHRRLVEVGRKVGPFRAVLWQQGESDVINGATTAEYAERMLKIRNAAVQAWGREPVWLLAKSTLHPTVYNNPAGEGQIRAAIDALVEQPGFRAGPDTDILAGENRGGLDSRRHFSAVGQRRAAAMWAAVAWQELNRPRPAHEVALRMLDELHLFEPAWAGPIVHRESSIRLQAAPGAPIIARLAFPAAEVMSVVSADGRHRFEPARDFQLSDDGLTLTFHEAGPAPIVSESELYPPEGAPDSYRHRVDHPEQNLLYHAGAWFHERDVEITYRRRDPAWPATVPTVAEQQLPRTLARLRAREPVVIGISGDSISTGLDSSASAGAAPFQPGYADLVAAQLHAHYGGEIELVNRAVPGWSITHGLNDLDAMLAAQPDLLVVAYGMNDVGRRDPAWFGEQVRTLVERVRSARPETEVLLVSPMLGNAEWVHTPRAMFGPYRDELAKLIAPGVALADVTAAWQIFTAHKRDLDLTGNGLNHPNDFGHRLYAQVVLAALCPASSGFRR